MRRPARALVALAFALSCLLGCVPVVVAKPVKPRPVTVTTPKPKPVTLHPKPPTAPVSKPVPAPTAPAIPAPAPGDWTGAWANDAATADNPDERSITADNVQDLHEVWSAPSGRSSSFPTSPMVADGLVFDTEAVPATIYTYDTQLSAFELQSGAVRWQRTLQSEQQLIGVAAGLVLVANPDFGHGSEVQAFDQKTGASRWTWNAPVSGQIMGTVITGSGHLLVPIAGGLYALDPSTGHQAFVATCTAAEAVNCPFDLLDGTASARSLFYIGGIELTAGVEFSSVDGHRLNPLGEHFPETSLVAPLISGDQVFEVGAYNGPDGQVGVVASFSTNPCGETFCTPQWLVHVPGGVSRLALSDGRLFVVGGGNGNLEALDPANGQVLWRGQAAPDEYGYLSVAGNVLYVVQGLTISAFPAAGCGSATICQPIWQYTVPDHTQLLDAPAVVTGGRLLYANYSGLHALAIS